MTLTTAQTQRVLDTIAKGAAEFFPTFSPEIILAEKLFDGIIALCHEAPPAVTREEWAAQLQKNALTKSGDDVINAASVQA